LDSKAVNAVAHAIVPDKQLGQLTDPLYQTGDLVL